MLLWSVTILSPVFAGAYAFRHRECPTSQARWDPSSLIQVEPSESDLKAYMAKDQEVIDTMMVDNLIAKAPPRTNPVTEVDIIGQEVLVNGKLYRVGDNVDDATITAISAQDVTVQWNGTSTTFSPIAGQDRGGASRGPSQRSGRPSPGSSTTRKRPKRGDARSVRVKPPREGKRMSTPEQKKSLRRTATADKKAATSKEKKNLKKILSGGPKVAKKARLKSVR